MLGAAGAVIALLQACFGFGTGAPPTAAPAAPPSPFAQTSRLAAFYAALATLDDKTATQPVRIIQVGDSHTANDALSGRLRERFQNRFGASGRGWLPAGIPFAYYRPHLVTVTESGWQHIKPRDRGDVPLGLDAVAAESTPRDAEMAIESSEPDGFDRFAVDYLAGPKGSPFTVEIDDAQPVRVATAAAVNAIRRFEPKLDRPAHRVVLRAKGRPPVVLLGWDIERRVPGVIYENHGTIGATVGLLGQMTPDAVAFELDERRPALLVVAFGTNEAADDTLDTERYAGRFTANVEMLQRAAHGAPVLVIGPPDGNRVAAGCSPETCGPDAGACAWHEPEKLAAVRDIERRAATQHGWAFWDWFAAMGGACSVDRMTAADPPLAARDHVHLTRAGYEMIADLLFADMMRGYDEWKAQASAS
jgi:lysophospholipase L1-like esterase